MSTIQNNSVIIASQGAQGIPGVGVPAGGSAGQFLIKNSNTNFDTGWAMQRILANATYDPPSLINGAGTTTTISITGAALGDFVLPSFSLDIQGITLTGYVSSANVVSVRFQNNTAGTLDLASGTLSIMVLKT
jgi:hypothetical protein